MTTTPTLSIDGFEGPIDGLLELARAQRVDWTKLSILALIEAFVAALDAALDRSGQQKPAPELARWGDWLVMAATLALLRSRLLLPPDSVEARAAESEAEALRERLVQRDALEVAARWLTGRPQLGQQVFARGAPERVQAGRSGDLAELFRACLAALAMREEVPDWPPPLQLWRVTDALAQIRQVLHARAEPTPLEDVLPKLARAEMQAVQCRAALASSFCRRARIGPGRGVLTLEQPSAFAAITLSPR